MVSSAKMLLKTETPSTGQPTLVNGSQLGEEYGRSPTRLMPFGPTTVPPGMNFPSLQALEGKCRPWPLIVVPPGMKKVLSSRNGPQVPAPKVALRSKQLCGLAGLMSCEANKRCPCDPTYPSCRTMSRATSL